MIQAVWIEIPVNDISRAMKFYQAVFDLPTTTVTDDGIRKTATFFAGADGQAGISLNQTKNFEPNNKGVLVYWAAGEELSSHLSRVEPAGGRVVEGKTSMGEAGYYALVKDTEGNVFALYSFK